MSMNIFSIKLIVENVGVEPTTSRMQFSRSSQLSYSPIYKWALRIINSATKILILFSNKTKRSSLRQTWTADLYIISVAL